jgi:hypothetical protein
MYVQRWCSILCVFCFDILMVHRSRSQRHYCLQQILSGSSSIPLPPHPPPGPPPGVQTETPSASLDNAFFASTATSSKSQVPPPAVKPKATAASPSTTSDNDWSKLPLSAIKRKPITEIMSYLQAKGRAVIDKNGRPLSKSELVDAIFSF